MIRAEDLNKLAVGIAMEAPGLKAKVTLVNKLCIYARMFNLYETKGVDKALDYYFGVYNEEEYKDYIDSIICHKVLGGEFPALWEVVDERRC